MTWVLMLTSLLYLEINGMDCGIPLSNTKMQVEHLHENSLKSTVNHTRDVVNSETGFSHACG